ncbi:helix-turn-helix domain-containing protein [Haloarcula laminariae]|uniref:helix-turn-helix domain-containing protein n=1 Tax=Haloarcula laminariae TaxID=2961577 RepID=UPI0021C79017|nr:MULTISPECIES: helix-turn-helix domain-containing protein [Halomicroarcula]
MYTASFSVNDSSTFGDVTARTNRTIRLWCNDDRDLLHVAGSVDDEVLDMLRSTVGVEGQASQVDEGIIVTKGCLRERASGFLEDYAQDAGCLLISPLRYERGEKRFQVVALKPAQISSFYQNLVEDGKSVTVESKREIQTVEHGEPLIAPANLVPEFTQRQRQVIETAYENGYYDIPRETTTAEIADELGISRRTVEEHLRRGEKKLMDGFIGEL